MAKTRQDKETMVSALAERLNGMRSIVFANYEGLSVSEVDDLRRKLTAESVGYTVAKKTLLRIALERAGVAVDTSTIAGNFATIVSKGDEVAPARIVAAFARDHEALKLAGGILEGHLLDRTAVLALAKLPTKKELLGKAVGSIAAPLSGFVNVLAGNLRGLVTVLGAIRDQRAA